MRVDAKRPLLGSYHAACRARHFDRRPGPSADHSSQSCSVAAVPEMQRPEGAITMSSSMQRRRGFTGSGAGAELGRALPTKVLEQRSSGRRECRPRWNKLAGQVSPSDSTSIENGGPTCRRTWRGPAAAAPRSSLRVLPPSQHDAPIPLRLSPTFAPLRQAVRFERRPSDSSLERRMNISDLHRRHWLTDPASTAR